jgi:hypothetical protein
MSAMLKGFGGLATDALKKIADSMEKNSNFGKKKEADL